MDARSKALTFGTMLQRLRRAAGLTQEALAERAHLSRRGISDLERGVNRTPHKETVALLTAALALSPPEREAFEKAARMQGIPGTLTAMEDGTALPAAMVWRPPFVGRAREMARVDRHLTEAGPPLLLLAGEPGIGKTRLLHEARRLAASRGLSLLSGGCQQRGGLEVYAPLLGAVEDYIDRLTSGQQRAALHGCAWLVRLLPELAGGPIEPLPSWTVSPAQERRLMGKAVLRFLANVAGPRGTLLLLDDLQWAGADALGLLTTLLHAATTVPLRVVGAYRDTEVQTQDPLGRFLADLVPAALVVHDTLGPLPPREAGRLLDAVLDDGAGDKGGATTTVGATERARLRAAVLERAEGVPFFLLSCAGCARGRAGGSGQYGPPLGPGAQYSPAGQRLARGRTGGPGHRRGGGARGPAPAARGSGR